jgi:hypothetical protein
VHLGETKFEETAERPIESQLNDVLRRIYRVLAAWRAQEPAREQAAEAARLQVEELRRQQQERTVATLDKEREAERERQLVDECAAWREAQAIRDYVRHLDAVATTNCTPLGPDLRQWIAWAASVAEKLDPTLKRLGGSGCSDCAGDI